MTQVQASWVITEGGTILVQVPDATSEWGFYLADDEQTWDGGFGVAGEWVPIPRDDPRITQEDRDAMEWMLPLAKGTRQTVEFRNDFHHTKCRLHARADGQGGLVLSRHQVDRARRRLCPRRDCRCGDTLGRRGPQEQAYEADPLPNGGVVLEEVEL